MFSTSDMLSGTGWWLWPTKPVTDGRVPHGGPGLVGEVHADQDVPGQDGALDHLALAVLDLRDLLGGDHDLVDVVLHVEGDDAVLEVGLHPVLHAGVGVHDEPVAGLGPQLAAELLERVARRRARPRRRLLASSAARRPRRRARRWRRRRRAPRRRRDVDGLGSPPSVASSAAGASWPVTSVVSSASAESYCSDTCCSVTSMSLGSARSLAGRGAAGVVTGSDSPAKIAKTSLPKARSSTETSAIMKITNTMTTKK